MKADNHWHFVVVEMTAHCIAHHFLQLLQRVCLGYDGMPQGMGFVTACG